MFLGDARAQVLNKAWSIYEFENSALDSKGHNISTATGITYADSGTVDGNYAIFNGSTSKIDLNVTDNYTEFTFMFKFYITAYNASGQYSMLTKNSDTPVSTTDFPFACGVGIGHKFFIAPDVGGNFSYETVLFSAADVPLSQINTIVGSVKENGNIKLCMNRGSVESLAMTTMSDNSRSFTLGAPSFLNPPSTAAQRYFNGRMYQAAYWTTQLTDAEMQLL